MLAYYGYTISPNQIETGEGFLICKNVPIARTGDMKYLPGEIGLEGGTEAITVHRSPDEVFSEAALASFEGKPVTDEHPPELLTPDTVTLYERGHAQNVRQGSGEWEGYVIADLHIHDGSLIEAVQRGKREISCGYECEYVDNGDGTYSQQTIRGNHVAVVERGRAGKRAAILDSDTTVTTVSKQADKRPERKKMKKHGLLFKLFGQAVKDKSPEEIEQLAMDAADALEEAEGSEPPATDTTLAEGGEAKPTDDGTGALPEAQVAEIVKRVMTAMMAKQSKDPIDEAIEKLSGCADATPAESGEAKTVPAEEEGKKGDSGEMTDAAAMDKQLAVAILKATRSAVAGITDANQRKAVSDALIACVSSGNDSDIAKIMQAARANAHKAADSTPGMDQDAIQAAYDAMNPHKMGGKK